MELGLPFRGTIKYWVEDSYGSGATGGAFAISAKVLNARFGLADKHKKLRGIDSPNACHLLEQCNDWTLHVEYVMQCDDTFLPLCVERDDCGHLTSLCFEVGRNVSCPTVDRAFNVLSGCKAKTVRISSSHNAEVIVAVDFSVKDSTPSTSELEGMPGTPTSAFLSFNTLGYIEKSGYDIAYITNAFDITMDNDIKDYWSAGSLDKQFAIEGEFNVDGSVDISLDEGGSSHLAEVLAQDDFNIEIGFGDSCPTITISDCKWKSSEIDVNISGDVMMESAPFTGKTVDISVSPPG